MDEQKLANKINIAQKTKYLNIKDVQLAER